VDSLSVDLLVYDFHGRLMRLLTPHVSVPLEDLGQLARNLRADRIVCNRTAKKLERLDVAYHINRHATKSRFDKFFNEVHTEVAKGLHEGAPADLDNLSSGDTAELVSHGSRLKQCRDDSDGEPVSLSSASTERLALASLEQHYTSYAT